MSISLIVNGSAYTVDLEPETPYCGSYVTR